VYEEVTYSVRETKKAFNSYRSMIHKEKDGHSSGDSETQKENKRSKLSGKFGRTISVPRKSKLAKHKTNILLQVRNISLVTTLQYREMITIT
jgi:hypothetical protein